MKTIESTLSHLTDLSIVEDLRKVLREKDREFLPVEAKFQESMRDLSTRIGKVATEELMTAWDRQICSDLVYAGYLGFQANLHNFHKPRGQPIHQTGLRNLPPGTYHADHAIPK